MQVPSVKRSLLFSLSLHFSSLLFSSSLSVSRSLSLAVCGTEYDTIPPPVDNIFSSSHFTHPDSTGPDFLTDRHTHTHTHTHRYTPTHTHADGWERSDIVRTQCVDHSRATAFRSIGLTERCF